MKTKKFSAGISIILLICLVFAIPANAGGVRKIVPGKTFKVQFPELPKTLAAVTAEIIVTVPRNYDPAKKHPVFLWLTGSKGIPWTGPGPGVAGSKGYICASFPLFKEASRNGKELNGASQIYITPADSKILWESFEVMLKELEKRIPNIDWSLSVAGGFSNGAHSIAHLSNYKKCSFNKYFKNLILCEGGYQLNNFKALKDGAILVVWGEKSLKGKLGSLAKRLPSLKIRGKGIEMKGVGHKADSKYFPQYGEFIKQDVILGAVPSNIRATYLLLRARKYGDAFAKYQSLQETAGDTKYGKDIAKLGKTIEKVADKAFKKVIGKIQKTKKDYILKKAIANLKKLIQDWDGTQAAETASASLEKAEEKLSAM